MARKWPTKKYQITSTRRGTSRFDDAYDAREAARTATRRAIEGYRAEVVTFGAGARGRRMVHMTCEPTVVENTLKPGSTPRAVARCSLKPAFKKRVKGL
jgi:hypothetical protein